MHRIINAEVTVVQKPHQGTNRQRGCNPLPGSFFVSFLDKQKRKISRPKGYYKKCKHFHYRRDQTLRAEDFIKKKRKMQRH